MDFPRYSHGQAPQTITVMQRLFGVVAPQGCRAVVLAPQPAAQPFPCPSLRPAEHPRALPVMEVSTPASQQPVQFTHCLGYAPIQGPVIEQATHVVPQPLLALGARLDMGIPAPTSPRALPANAKTQELETLPAVHLSSLLFVELQPSGLQPLSQSLDYLASLSRGTQNDEVIRVTHHHRSAWLLGVVDRPVQRIEVEVGQQRRDNSALWHALPVGQHAPSAVPFLFHNRSLQPLFQQVQDAAVADAPGRQLHQPVMGGWCRSTSTGLHPPLPDCPLAVPR
jgi:hypothetical protein